MKCIVCGLRFEPDSMAESKCVAKHAVGVCCHWAYFLICEDGSRQRFAAWPDCQLVSIDFPPESEQGESSAIELQDRPSREAVGCSCTAAFARVRLVEHRGILSTVCQCLSCNDTRVTRMKVVR